MTLLNWIAQNGYAAFWFGLFILVLFDRAVTLILGLRGQRCCACDCHDEPEAGETQEMESEQ